MGFAPSLQPLLLLSFHPLCLLPCPTGVYRFLTSSFLRIRFACILCLSTIATKKKANSLHFVYPCVCLCLYRRVLQDYAYAMWVSYTKNSTLYYVVYYVCFDKLCKWHARDASFRVEAASTQMLFFWFCFSDCAAAHCPACFIKCGPQSICVFMT